MTEARGNSARGGVISAFVLGWHVAELFHTPVPQSAQRRQATLDKLVGIGDLDPLARARLLLAQVSADLERVRQIRRLRAAATGSGCRPVAAPGRGPSARPAAGGARAVASAAAGDHDRGRLPPGQGLRAWPCPRRDGPAARRQEPADLPAGICPLPAGQPAGLAGRPQVGLSAACRRCCPRVAASLGGLERGTDTARGPGSAAAGPTGRLGFGGGPGERDPGTPPRRASCGGPSSPARRTVWTCCPPTTTCRPPISYWAISAS